MQRWWLVAALALAGGMAAHAVIPEGGGATHEQSGTMVERLSDPERSAAALDALVRERDVRTLSEIAESSVDVSARGWAVVGLAKVGGEDAERVLLRIEQDAAHPMLVRTWAAAARVNRADDLEEVRQLANLRYTFPGLDRPLRLRVEALIGTAKLEDLLALSMDGALQPLVMPRILEQADEGGLVTLMYTHPEDAVRRQATAFAGTLATQSPGSTQVPDLILARLTPPRNLDQVPWEGGALYVPGIQWGKDDGRLLIHTLAAWWLLLESQGRSSELNQVWNNLYNYSLLTGAGYDMNLYADPVQLVRAIARVEGTGTAREVLGSVGLQNDRRFAEVL